jgi:tetratricopeptide (TPR) repeat protein
VAIAPNDRAAHFDLAEVYRAQDKLDQALVEYLAAALIDPANANTFGMIGQVEVAAGRDEQAVVMLRRAIALNEGLLEARYALSRATASSRPHRRITAGTPCLRSRAGQGDGEQRRQFRDNQQKIDEVLKTK